MITKTNCWDFMKCGRQYGGVNEKKLGNCPAVTYIAFSGRNGGFRSGRYCWYVAGTFHNGEPQCTYASELKTCKVCDFYKLVKKEEGTNFRA